jgi:hypothetical protein
MILNTETVSLLPPLCDSMKLHLNDLATHMLQCGLGQGLGLPMKLILFLFLAQVVAYPQVPSSSIEALPDAGHIKTLLKSADSKDQAWGAWFANQGQDRDVIPLLQQVVAQHVDGKDWLTDGLPMDAALDALIQLDAKVSPGFVTSIYQKRKAPAFILLSKLEHEGDSILLDLASKEKGIKWFAAANLLQAHRTPGTACMLLRNIEIMAEVTVSDNGSILGAGRGGMSGSVADGGGGRTPGYPPIAHYYLDAGAGNGGILLALGPVAIYYCRLLSKAGELPPPTDHDRSGPLTWDRLRYVAALGHFKGKMPIYDSMYRSVIWRGQSALESEVSDFKQDILRRFSTLVKMLQDANLLTAEEASALPSPVIQMRVEDRRSKK